MNQSLIPAACVAALGVALAGCGGGGGGGGSAGSDPVALDAGNASAAAREVRSGLNAATLISGSLTTELTGGDILAEVLGGASGDLAQQTVACPFSGFLNWSGSVAGGGTYTPGDRFLISFSDCQYANNAPIINGAADLVVTAVTGSLDGPTDYELALSAAVDRFQVRQLAPFAVTARGTGQLELEIAADYPEIDPLQPERLTQSLSSPRFDLTAAGEDYLWEGLTVSSVLDLTGPATITAEAAGALTSSALGGRLEVATPVPLVFPADNDPDTYAYEGSQTITGAGDSRVTLAPVDELSVRLDVDADGDGVAEDSLEVAWSELLPGG